MRRLSFLSERITDLRMKKGVTESEMSKALGRNPGYVNRITTGRGYPGYRELIHICDYFEISPSAFFDITDATRRKGSISGKLERLTVEELVVLESIVDCILKK